MKFAWKCTREMNVYYFRPLFPVGWYLMVFLTEPWRWFVTMQCSKCRWAEFVRARGVGFTVYVVYISRYVEVCISGA